MRVKNLRQNPEKRPWRCHMQMRTLTDVSQRRTPKKTRKEVACLISDRINCLVLHLVCKPWNFLTKRAGWRSFRLLARFVFFCPAAFPSAGNSQDFRSGYPATSRDSEVEQTQLFASVKCKCVYFWFTSGRRFKDLSLSLSFRHGFLFCPKYCVK